MDTDVIKKYAAYGAVALVVVGAGWFLWNRTSTPAPVPAPGQTIQNPFGTASPGGQAAPAPGGISPSPATLPAVGTPGSAPGAGASPSAPPVPAVGTFDPKVGFGPSPGGPFRRRR